MLFYFMILQFLCNSYNQNKLILVLSYIIYWQAPNNKKILLKIVVIVLVYFFIFFIARIKMGD